MLMSLATCGALLLLLWLAAVAVFIIAYRHELRRSWREPVFRHPILIVESDDWGAGPLTQADALRAIADVIHRHRDATGRAPTFNLALVLAVPDGPAIQAGGGYSRLCLDAPMFHSVLSALRVGQRRGVFALQLHALEHYWPDTLMNSSDVHVQDWLRQPAPAMTEQLPSHLQSRWVDASRLPSEPHSEHAIRAAVAEEVQAFTRILGVPPKVVVPPTFVWTRATELAWAAQGLECIVTPGWRYTTRNAGGLPDGDEGPFFNGERAGGVSYLVRTDYFEPSRGRDALHVLRVLQRTVSEGRPCVLENHRDNFIGDPQMCERSLVELDKVYGQALARQRDLRFLSTWELSRILDDRDPLWLISNASERLPFVWTRVRNAGRLWKVMVLTGLAVVGGLFVRTFAASAVKVADTTFR
jgi:hypothetical protein